MKRFVVFAALVLFAAPAFGAESHPIKRVALVIGASDYSELKPLSNPGRDADSVADILDRMGFVVTPLTDVTGRKLKRAIDNFIDDADGADLALIYYSGHGVEVAGDNYMIPTDASIATPQTAGESLVPVDDLVDRLAKIVPATIVLLDACRTNPFAPGQLVALPGEAAQVVPIEGIAVRGPTVTQPTVRNEHYLGSVVGFAASPGQVAQDGPTGGHSPYAAALIEHLGDGAHSFADVMTIIAREVYLDTHQEQLPWTHLGLTDLLYLTSEPEAVDDDNKLILDDRRELLLTINGLTDDTRAFVETVADSEAVSLDALYGMLRVALETKSNGQDLEKQLLDGARQLRDFADRAPRIIRDDAELVRLNALADEARNQGAIGAARTFRAEATARARVLDTQLNETVSGLKLDIAATYARDAEEAVLAFDFDYAADLFEDAYETAKPWDESAAFQYRSSQAQALINLGGTNVNHDALNSAIGIMEDVLRDLPVEAPVKEVATARSTLGLGLFVLGTLESDGTTLERSITEYDAGLALAVEPEVRASMLNGKGLAAWALGMRLTEATQLLVARQAFEEAGTIWTETNSPANWATVQMNLANTLNQLGARQGDMAAVQQAVDISRDLLARHTEVIGPAGVAVIQMNLGYMLWTQGTNSPTNELLVEARTTLEAALTFVKRNESPSAWALATNNLGLAVLSIGQRAGDLAMLRQAAADFEAAIEVMSREDAPLQWGLFNSNLAFTLQTIANMERDAPALDRVIGLYETALKEVTRKTAPTNWALITSNYADAMQLRSQATGIPIYLTRAAALHRSVLEVWTRKDAPTAWALGEMKLGFVLFLIGTQTSSGQDLADAVSALNASLEVVTFESAPNQWFAAKSSLGVAQQALGEMTADAATLDAAIATYKELQPQVPVDTNPDGWLQLNARIAGILHRRAMDAKSPDLLREVRALEEDIRRVASETDNGPASIAAIFAIKGIDATLDQWAAEVPNQAVTP
ncbi:MAG: caspase family protein [Devosia sp.]